MCGVWGFIAGNSSTFNPHDLKKTLDRLFIMSESRGKEAAGLALSDDSTLTVLKAPISANALITRKEYANLIREYQLKINIAGAQNRVPIVAIGHARMVTNGAAENHQNNQPVIKNGMVCIHNGIIVNDTLLWSAFPSLKREYEVDTEILLSLISHYRASGYTFIDSVSATFNHLQGANTVALLSSDLDAVVTATTNGSLYYAASNSGRETLFVSERCFLEKIINIKPLKHLFRGAQIIQVKANEGCLFSFGNPSPRPFMFSNKINSGELAIVKPRTIRDLSFHKGSIIGITAACGISDSDIRSFDNVLSLCKMDIDKLKRCSRCVLPETFPFIVFDQNGVCNYCNNYNKLEFSGEEALRIKLGKGHSSKTKPDCIVALSGGRDSCYGIHLVKQKLNMNPLAYTYDWGMVTNLARRNISRLCGKLKIEHILISADIRKKRSYIRKNVLAWLKKPALGMVPLFMAGDKQYFYYANRLMKQYGINMLVMSENRLERTHFKHGFCGIRHSDSHKPAYDFTIMDTAKLAYYYARAYLLNPAYINRSLIDTIGGFLSFYLIPHNYIYLYNYLQWDEGLVENTLINEYDWEIAPETKSTWRIGDGTAPFYNYIYYVVAGFTEHETFRSNQIREGLIERDTALAFIERDNMPRYESIKWYCETIGIDFDNSINMINGIPKLYHRN